MRWWLQAPETTCYCHPAIKELHIKFWLGQFLMPIFSSREEAMFFEPLLEAIDEHAKRLLPKEFK